MHGWVVVLETTHEYQSTKRWLKPPMDLTFVEKTSHWHDENLKKKTSNIYVLWLYNLNDDGKGNKCLNIEEIDNIANSTNEWSCKYNNLISYWGKDKTQFRLLLVIVINILLSIIMIYTVS